MTAISASDIVLLLSAPGASAGYTVTGLAGNSLGNYVSTTVLSTTPLDNLFTDLTGAQNAASQIDYACLFVLNNTATGNSMLNTVAWLPSSGFVVGGANIAIGVDPAAASPKGSSTPQAALISVSTNAPTGVSPWISPTSSTPSPPIYSGGVQLGTIAPGYVKAIWFRRSATNSPPVNNDGFQLNLSFDTQG